MFPEDAAIGVVNYNPGWTVSDNGGAPVEVIEPIETGSFEELAGLTVVGEARRFGTGTFNTPPLLELWADAKSFTVHTGDGNGNFVTFQRADLTFASTALNQIMVDTAPEMLVGLPGDFDGNGSVGNGDLTLLLDNWGDAVPPTPTGWNGLAPTTPGVGNDELTALLDGWGDVADAASAVPEPTTLLLAVMGACILGIHRR